MNLSLAMQASITIKEKMVSCNKRGNGSLRGSQMDFRTFSSSRSVLGQGQEVLQEPVLVSYSWNSQVWFPRSTDTRLPAPR